MKSEIVDYIFKAFSDNNPNPTTELAFTNNFTLSISIILSAQATDISVNKATKNLFLYYNTPEKILSLGEDGLKAYIKTIGLFNVKSKNIIALCKILISDFNSTIPSKFNDLVKLPGIGRKTANVILNCAFKKLTVGVDTHVHRVSNRVGLSLAKSPRKVEEDLLSVISSRWLINAHHWLILHGRYTCKARKPDCTRCSITKYCKYYKENNV